MQFRGNLKRSDSRHPFDWSFEGEMQYFDEWNFDPREKKLEGENNRSNEGEEWTRFANKYLIGKPFMIQSEWIKVKQTSKEKNVDWYNNKEIKSIPNRVSEFGDTESLSKDNK